MTARSEVKVGGDASLQGRRVLVAEDRLLVAKKLVQILNEARCTVAGPVPTLREGLALARQDHGSLNAAVLDIDLRGETGSRPSTWWNLGWN